MDRIRPLARCALLAGALACARTPPSSGPAPLSVVPAQSTGFAAVAVEIAGRDFDAWTRDDLSRAGGGTVDARFTAELELTPGGNVLALQDVTLTPRRTLQATVPAGAPRGVYRLHVTDPRGRTGVLDEAFRVVTPAEAVASFRVDVLEAPRAGVGFAVALTAIDAQGLVVEGFDASVTLADGTGALSPAAAGPFLMGRCQLRATIAELATGDRITATGRGGRTGASEPFDVVAGPPMAIVFPQRSVVAAAGACSPEVQLELRDALGHPSAAAADVAVQLQSAPPELGFFTDAACTAAVTSVTVPAGASRAAFHFRAAAAGTVTLRALPATLPSASQDETVSP